MGLFKETIRVVAYCRVSTNKEDQSNSYEAQKRFFETEIKNHDNWTFVAIYADEGITGTSTKNRTEFNQMIRDAHLGEFDLIITKSVSRFARNTVDTLMLSRELRRAGVYITFLLDKINTLDDDYESRLSDKARDAQESSRITSVSVQWGLGESMKEGTIMGSCFFGYDRIDKNTLVVNPREAEIVRFIFRRYLEGIGTYLIAKELEHEGVKTKKGNTRWYHRTVLGILKNEKYMGDLVLGKWWTPDYLTHERKRNEGEKPQYIFQNRIQPIIDRETFEKVQAEIKRRSTTNGRGRYSNRHAFSGKLRCGECGKGFQSVYQRNVRYWKCVTRTKFGDKHKLSDGRELGCNQKMILREDVLQSIVLQLLKHMVQDKSKIRAEAIEAVSKTIDIVRDKKTKSRVELEKKISDITTQRLKLIDLCCQGLLTDDDLKLISAKYDDELSKLKAELGQNSSPKPESVTKRGALKEEIIQHIDDVLSFETFNDEICREMIDQIIIIDKTHFEIHIRGILGQNQTFQVLPSAGGTGKGCSFCFSQKENWVFSFVSKALERIFVGNNCVVLSRSHGLMRTQNCDIKKIVTKGQKCGVEELSLLHRRYVLDGLDVAVLQHLSSNTANRYKRVSVDVVFNL